MRLKSVALTVPTVAAGAGSTPLADQGARGAGGLPSLSLTP
jgi:hypothetical protein